MHSISENQIDMEILLTMSEDDVKSIGVEPFGMRRKIAMKIKETVRNQQNHVSIVINL